MKLLPLLVCACLAVLSSYNNAVTAMPYLELVKEEYGEKACHMNLNQDLSGLEATLAENRKQPELVVKILELTKVREPQQGGCKWARFTELLDLLKAARFHPAPTLVKAALMRQFNACKHEIEELPQSDGLSLEERNALAAFGGYVSPLQLSESKLVEGIFKFLKSDRNVSFKKVNKQSKRMEFSKLFHEQMDFCFGVSNKWHHYFELVDQVADGNYKSVTVPELIRSRVEAGFACRQLDIHMRLVEEAAFKKAVGWFGNLVKELKDLKDDD